MPLPPASRDILTWPLSISLRRHPRNNSVFGIRHKSPNVVDKKDIVAPGSDSDMRIHFVFTDQEGRLDRGYHARGSKDAIRKILSEIRKSRADSEAQTLDNAAAFQAALACDRVCIVTDGVGKQCYRQIIGYQVTVV